MTAPHTPAERETPAGEAMREAVAFVEGVLRKELIVRRDYDSVMRSADWIDGTEVAASVIASKLARLTAERDEAREGEKSVVQVCDSYADENQRFHDRFTAAEAALTSLRADHAAEVARREIVVDVMTMQTTRGPDFFVRITCGGRSQTPHVFRERFKAEYEVAHLQWVLGLRPDEPDLMAYDETSHPNAALAITEKTDA